MAPSPLAEQTLLAATFAPAFAMQFARPAAPFLHILRVYKSFVPLWVLTTIIQWQAEAALPESKRAMAESCEKRDLGTRAR